VPPGIELNEHTDAEGDGASDLMLLVVGQRSTPPRTRLSPNYDAQPQLAACAACYRRGALLDSPHAKAQERLLRERFPPNYNAGSRRISAEIADRYFKGVLFCLTEIAIFGEDGMTEKEFTTDPVAVLEQARAEIDTVRRTLQRLHEQFVQTNGSAKEIARNELCKALVERLQLAEREAAELVEMVVLVRDSTGS
jgi:hypothetical protein